MTVVSNLETYLTALKHSGLVPPQRLKEVFAGFKKQGVRITESQQLADLLEQAGLVTDWQNQKLLAGRYRGFFLGKYKLLGHLGTGGMGTVYLAEHTKMRRRVAIKVLPERRATDDTSYLDRFHREAQAIAALDHRNIVQAYDVDNHGDLHYIALEYIDGEDLEKIVKRDGPLDWQYAVDYIRQAAAGLDHAHGRGMIHRDIKPSNLLLDKTGTIKILDMGLARLTGKDQQNITLEYNDGVIGTADYLPPEQALDSHNCDARADIYALGCTLFFLLSGEPPFNQGSMAERLMAHQRKPVPPLAGYRDDVPPEVEEVIQKMTAKKLDDRYQSAAEVRQTLRELAGGVTSTSGMDAETAFEHESAAYEDEAWRQTATNMTDTTSELPAVEVFVEPESSETEYDDYDYDEAKPKGPSPIIWLVAGGGGLLLLAGLALVLLHGPSDSESEQLADVRHRRSFVDENVVWNPQAASANATKSVQRTGPVDAKSLPGVIVDDEAATFTGDWIKSQITKPYVALGYRHDNNEEQGKRTARFEAKLSPGAYEVRFAYTTGTNRATNVPVTVTHAEGQETITVNEQQTPAHEGLFATLGTWTFGDTGVVEITNDGTNGHVLVDAVQFLPVVERTPLAGGGGGDAFEHLDPAGGPVLGVRFNVKDYAGRPTLEMLIPVYDRAAAAEGATLQLARDGYALGVVEAAATNYVHALRLTFMKLDGPRLNPNDAYTTDWFGDPQQDPVLRLGGNGQPVAGIYGRKGGILDAVGVVLRGDEGQTLLFEDRPGKPFQQDADGLVCVEAENYATRWALQDANWVLVEDAQYSGGKAMQVPDGRRSSFDTYVNVSPQLTYQVQFQRAGKHYVWVLGLGAGGTNDSCHVGLDGQASPDSEAITGFNDTIHWVRKPMKKTTAVIDVKQPGLHTLCLWMREDGCVVDKLLLTPDSKYRPDGQGPKESPRAP